MRCFMLLKINANIACMYMLWNDAWMNYASENFCHGKINPDILVGDICIDDPFLAGDIWFLSDGRNIQQNLTGDKRDDQSV